MGSANKFVSKLLGELMTEIQIFKSLFKDFRNRGAWVAQSVGRPTLAQVMTSRFMRSSPVSGSVLTARSLEPASASVSPSLSLPFPARALSLKNKFKKH